jgi:hypothetical protein
MKEAKANLWEYPAEYRVITTNGYVNKEGKAVMGRGCAKEAAKKYPKLPRWLGIVLNNHGNHVHLFPDNIITFPVKHNWWEDADIKLITQSAYDLVDLCNRIGARSVVMPRPGCGNGRLHWPKVHLVLKAILDDRFTVVSFDSEQ